MSVESATVGPRTIHIISLHADPASPSGIGGTGGTHAYLRELLTLLPQRGWSCTVVTRRTSTALPERQAISAKADIIRVTIGPLAPMHKSFLEGMHAESVAQIGAVLDSLPHPRLLHSVYWNSGRVALDLSNRFGIRYVHTVISNGARRGMTESDRDERRIEVESAVFMGASRIFCISREERNDLISLYGVDPARIVVVGRPVSAAFRYPAHDQNGAATLPPPWMSGE
jgi:glycosyltransferase involved in cell wall biosynthesis